MSAYATSCVEPVPGLTPARAHPLGKRSGLWSRYRLVGFLLGSGLLHVALLLISGTLTLPTLVPHPGGPPTIAARLDADASPHPPVPRPADHGHRAHIRPALALRRDAARRQGVRAQRRVAPAAHVASTLSYPTVADPRSARPMDETHTTRPAPVYRMKAARAPHDITRTRRASAPAASPAVRGAAVRAVIERALQAHFYYPYVARRNGWQGEIDLGLRIDADGRIRDVHVVKSSGYGVLDRAALASARSIKVLPKLVDLLYGHTVNLVLPVRYRLYEG